MRYWKSRGVRVFDWGGQGDYKEKYGCHKVLVPRFCQSKFAVVSKLRDSAKFMFHFKKRVEGWLTVDPKAA